MRHSIQSHLRRLARPTSLTILSGFVGLALSLSAQANSGRPDPRKLAEPAKPSVPAMEQERAHRPRNLLESADGPIAPDLGAIFAQPKGGARIGGGGYQATITGFGTFGVSTGSGSKPSSALSAAGSRTNAPWYYELTINAGTGYIEKFLVQPPPNYMTAGPRPLLMVFHKFGVSQKDAVVNTTYFQEAWSRGWYAIAPLGAAQVHFSSIESQINTEAVLDWTLARFSIDPTRIYGVGFSMGGGAAMNYAARHLDPSRAMLAAVVDHTGTASVADTYLKDPSVGWMIDYWFGDTTPGSADQWKMDRSSVINIDPAGPSVQASASLARNLLHVALRIVRASNDSVQYLSQQSDLLDQYMKSLGVQGGGRYGYYVLPYNGHSWDMLDEKGVCDWLGQQTLLLPTEGKTMADHDGVYFDLTIKQDAPNAFTPFDWKFDGAQNSFSLTNTTNLLEVSFDLADVALDPLQPLNVSLSTADGLADDVRIKGYPALPLAVLRDGLPETSWSYDTATHELVLHEYDGGAHAWQFVP